MHNFATSRDYHVNLWAFKADCRLYACSSISLCSALCTVYALYVVC